MISLIINNYSIQVKKNITVFQACKFAGVEVPHFCYHEKLAIAGNCRICLVEIAKFPKPVASCAIPVIEGIKIYTETPLVKKSRESIIEFLLMNHPLDCPICDQGGECDLQEQSMLFGSDKSRFFETKRSVSDKILFQLICGVITRCIQCTRCVRYFNEILGSEILGIINRGLFVEVSQYNNKRKSIPLSGNVIELCPVGFLIKINLMYGSFFSYYKSFGYYCSTTNFDCVFYSYRA